jgi:CheY-like chemotaxis protein
MNKLPGPLLVVEDVPNILELLEVTLRFKGYTVITATNGQEALDLIAKEPPALVITDILMPKMDGYALVHHLRTNPKTSHIPIIFLSATYVTPQDRDFALSLGAVRFLEKPVDTQEFLLTIAEVLAEGCDPEPLPMDKEKFYRGYRERLEGKLRHKISQIARTERLLETLPPEQQPSFQLLLEDLHKQRSEIQDELDEIYAR